MFPLHLRGDASRAAGPRTKNPEAANVLESIRQLGHLPFHPFPSKSDPQTALSARAPAARKFSDKAP